MIHCFWVLALLLTVSIVTCNGIIVSTTLQIFGMWDQIILIFVNKRFQNLPISSMIFSLYQMKALVSLENYFDLTSWISEEWLSFFLYISWDWCIYLEKCLYFRAGRTLEGVSAMVRRHNLFFRIYCCLNKAPKYYLGSTTYCSQVISRLGT